MNENQMNAISAKYVDNEGYPHRGHTIHRKGTKVWQQ